MTAYLTSNKSAKKDILLRNVLTVSRVMFEGKPEIWIERESAAPSGRSWERVYANEWNIVIVAGGPDK